MNVGVEQHESDLFRALDLIRVVPDFPQPGILFRDISPMLSDAHAHRVVVDALAAHTQPVDVVVGIEARGFLLGASVAYALGVGIVGVRKPGKLPEVAAHAEYSLEYGVASIELPEGTLWPGQRALIVDDVLATGGTLAAACELTRRAGADIAGVAVVLELAELGGRVKLGGQRFRALASV